WSNVSDTGRFVAPAPATAQVHSCNLPRFSKLAPISLSLKMDGVVPSTSLVRELFFWPRNVRRKWCLRVWNSPDVGGLKAGIDSSFHIHSQQSASSLVCLFGLPKRGRRRNLRPNGCDFKMQSWP